MRGQQAFFDVRLFDPNANRYLNKHKHYFNSTSKMKKEETKNTMKEFHSSCILNLWGYGKIVFYNRQAKKIAGKRYLHLLLLEISL